MSSVEQFALGFAVIGLVAGIATMVGGIWQLRRQHVTAKQAVQWRHRMHGLSEDVREGMPPRLTDAFILAGRRYLGSVIAAFGAGLVIVGLVLLVLWSVTLTEQFHGVKLLILEAIESLSIGLILSFCVGIWWGISSIPRQPRGTPSRYHIRDFRHWALPIWPTVVLLAASALCVYTALHVRALPLDTSHAGDDQPNFWALLGAPIPFFVLLVAQEVFARRIAALPPLALPMETAIAEPYDRQQRSTAIRQLSGMGAALLMGIVYVFNYALTFLLGPGLDQVNLVVAIDLVIIFSAIAYMLMTMSVQASPEQQHAGPPQPSAPSD